MVIYYILYTQKNLWGADGKIAQFLAQCGQIAIRIGPKVSLKQVNRINPLQTSKFSHQSPKKNFLSVVSPINCHE